MQELIDFLKSTVDGTRNAMRTMSPAYAGLAYSTNLDGPLPYADLCAFGCATIIVGGCVAYGLGQGAKDFMRTRTKSASKENENDTTNSQSQNPTYYHVTSVANAASIISTGIINPGEGGYVYAWKMLPSNQAISQSEARYCGRGSVVISFQTNAPFEIDSSVSGRAQMFLPVRTCFPGMIKVSNVVIIRSGG